jgi:hypothetical protein
MFHGSRNYGEPKKLVKGVRMARKKAPKLTKRQRRKLRIQQVIAVIIGLIIILSMLVQFIY